MIVWQTTFSLSTQQSTLYGSSCCCHPFVQILHRRRPFPSPVAIESFNILVPTRKNHEKNVRQGSTFASSPIAFAPWWGHPTTTPPRSDGSTWGPLGHELRPSWRPCQFHFLPCLPTFTFCINTLIIVTKKHKKYLISTPTCLNAFSTKERTVWVSPVART